MSPGGNDARLRDLFVWLRLDRGRLVGAGGRSVDGLGELLQVHVGLDRGTEEGVEGGGNGGAAFAGGLHNDVESDCAQCVKANAESHAGIRCSVRHADSYALLFHKIYLFLFLLNYLFFDLTDWLLLLSNVQLPIKLVRKRPFLEVMNPTDA
jgi:hypothetical protein